MRRSAVIPSPTSPDGKARTILAIAILGVALLAATMAFLRVPFETRAAPGQSTDKSAAVAASFTPPPLSAIPEGPEGEAIRRGLAIFHDTRTNAGDHVGNAMACSNCHLDDGRAANSAPMWAAWVAYPQFRKKTGTMNTMADRITQCFRYSMNAPNSPSGKPPAADSAIVADLQTYFHWLAKGAPTGMAMEGGGYPKPVLLAGGFDPARGAAIFEAKCSSCHGADGQGAIDADGKVVYPPLWGPESFNWGAGMARVDLAAGFIKANMPFGEGGTLSDQDAWDVAAFVDRHERPRDPRQTGTVAANAKANFAGQKSYYGQTVDGKLVGTGVDPQH